MPPHILSQGSLPFPPLSIYWQFCLKLSVLLLKHVFWSVQSKIFTSMISWSIEAQVGISDLSSFIIYMFKLLTHILLPSSSLQLLCDLWKVWFIISKFPSITYWNSSSTLTSLIASTKSLLFLEVNTPWQVCSTCSPRLLISDIHKSLMLPLLMEVIGMWLVGSVAACGHCHLIHFPLYEWSLQYLSIILPWVFQVQRPFILLH
jgi:hypothetical protein